MPFLATCEIWSFLLTLHKQAVVGQFSVAEFFRVALFMQQVNTMQGWFIPYIVGVYVALPVLSCVAERMPPRLMLPPLALAILAFFIWPDAALILRINGLGSNGLLLNTSFLGGCNGVYFFVGYYLNRYRERLSRIGTDALVGIALGSYVLTGVFQWCVLSADINIKFGYDVLTMLTCASALFLLAMRVPIRREATKRALRWLSRGSLGVFFMHMVAMRCVAGIPGVSALRQPIRVGALFVMTAVLSYLFVFVLSLSRTTRRLLLNIKK